MAYQKQQWEDEVTVITAARMNHIEDGIANVEKEQGPEGPQGMDGQAATVQIGKVESGDVASVTNVGTENAAILDFVLPKGEAGAQGPAGDNGRSATISAGTVTMLDNGAQPTVTNSGTDEAAVFDFGIPKAADAKQIQDIVLNKDGSGTITGGQLNFSDGTNVPITVTEQTV